MMKLCMMQPCMMQPCTMQPCTTQPRMMLELGMVLWGGQKFYRFTSIWNSNKVFQKLIIFCPDRSTVK
jgi:hypothetical protein